MRLEKWFHAWFYLCLALAGGCLALPSTFFIGWMPALLALTLVLFFLAWRHEGQWVLSDAAANHLGVFIALGAAGWIIFQVPRSEDDLIAGGVPWPAGLLPHLGPLLMILLMVKVFRPKKLPDFWVIQTIGLMMVTLAAVLADSPGFGILLTLYLVSLIWCLALYHPVREQRLLGRDVDANQAALFAEAGAARWPAPWRLAGGLRVARWTLAVLFLGQLIFLMAPRQAPSHWVARQLGPASSQVVRTEAGMDLNVVGRVELSEDVAFTVTALDAQGSLQVLGPNHHWQGELFEFYTGGKWYPLAFAQERLQKTRGYPTRKLQLKLTPRLGEGLCYYSFTLRPLDAGTLVLAEPAEPDKVGIAPHLDGEPDNLGFFAELEGCDAVFGVVRPRSQRKVYHYGQAGAPWSDPARFPARVSNERYRGMLSVQGIRPEVEQWTHALLPRLPGLSDEDRALDPDLGVPEAAHAKVAEALCRHLAHSGEFRYSLDLRRVDKTLDPAVDFLLNVKEGHCERYAGALALMLRSVRIPCRVVRGYLGASFDEEASHYVVLKNQAHSWVQALVPDGAGGWQWLVLEPTPSNEATDNAWDRFTRWFWESFDVRMMWRQLIVEYTPDQQLAMADGILAQLGTRRAALVFGMLVGVLALAWGVRAAWRWAARSGPATGRASAEAVIYQRLVKLLARRLRLQPLPGQTPREFALHAADLLSERGVGDGVAEAPVRIVAGYYAARYGPAPFSAGSRAALESDLDALTGSLRRS